MYIAVEGVIGVGKTTLVRMLKERFDAQVCLEVFEENPFLSNFYTDRERFGFQTQIFFLLSRYHQQRRDVPDVLAAGISLLSDYTFEKDAIFAELNISGDELEMYHRVHKALAEKVPVPDLTVYLRADTEMLMRRITSRDRPYERDMDRDYIDALNQTYDRFFDANRGDRAVLVLDTDDLDFVHYSEHLDLIENRIRQRLELVPFQPELPLDPS